MALRPAPLSYSTVLARCEAQRKRNTYVTGYGQCLGTSRKLYALPTTGLKSATSAVNASKQWHHDRDSAPGAHGLFTGGSHGYGHSVIMAGGEVNYSVDIGGDDRIYRTTITAIERAWGLHWVGWTTDYANRYQLDVKGYDTRGKEIVAVKPVVKKAAGNARVTTKLNGRASATTTGRVLVVRPAGYEISYTAVVKANGRVWLKTAWGTYYAAAYTNYKASK